MLTPLLIDIYLQKFGGCQVVIIDKVILDGSEYLVQECLHGLVEVPGDAVQPVRLVRVDLGRGRWERNFRSIKCKLINIEIGDQRCEASGGPAVTTLQDQRPVTSPSQPQCKITFMYAQKFSGVYFGL